MLDYETITLTYRGKTFEIGFEYTPPDRGTRDREGALISPDWPEVIVPVTAQYKGEDWTEFFTEEMWEEIKDILIKMKEEGEV